MRYNSITDVYPLDYLRNDLLQSRLVHSFLNEHLFDAAFGEHCVLNIRRKDVCVYVYTHRGVGPVLCKLVTLERPGK